MKARVIPAGVGLVLEADNEVVGVAHNDHSKVLRITDPPDSGPLGIAPA